MKKDRRNDDSVPGRVYTLPREKILRGRNNFQRLFVPEASVIRETYIDLRFRTYKDGAGSCLMGFIVKRKLGKAVKRNRVKRLLREAYRLNQHILTDAIKQTQIAFHGVLIAKTLEIDFNSAEQEVIDLLHRVKQHIHALTE